MCIRDRYQSGTLSFTQKGDSVYVFRLYPTVQDSVEAEIDVYKRQIKGKPARVPGTDSGNSDSLSVGLLSAPFLDITFSPHLQFLLFLPGKVLSSK